MKLYFFTALIACLVCTACDAGQKKNPIVKDGFLDLTGWHFDEDGTVNLNGTWEFYWKKL